MDGFGLEAGLLAMHSDPVQPWPSAGQDGAEPHNAAVHSKRFDRPVIVTRHAAQRMTERNVTEALLLQVIDEGSTRYSDSTHLWVWLDVPARSDNLVCAVLVLEVAVVVKTVMNHWEIMR